MVSSVFLVGSGSEIDEEVLAMASFRQGQANELTRYIQLLCSRGTCPKDREFIHFLDVVWPLLVQFIDKASLVSMNQLLTTQWDELELEADSDDDTEEEPNVMPGHEESGSSSPHSS